MFKNCKYCQKNKENFEFNKCFFTNDGFQYKCRECEKSYRKQNSERISERMKLYHSKEDIKEIRKLKNKKRYNINKEHILRKNREWQINNKEKDNKRRRNKYNENSELNAKKAREKRYRNIDHYRKYQCEWKKKKRKENIRYVIEDRLRGRIWIALKRQSGKKAYKTIDLLGCEIDFFLKYIESLFTEGMNWEKLKNKEIEIDHILPCCQFNLLDENEQKKCFHYTNLQPIWKKDHIIKSKEDRKLTIKNKV